MMPDPVLTTNATMKKQQKGRKLESGVSYDGETIVLKSAWQKAKQQGKTPKELIWHLVLLIIVIMQIWFYNLQTADFVRSQKAAWNRYFLGDASFSDNQGPLSSSSLLFTHMQVSELVHTMIEGYYDIKSSSVTKVGYTDNTAIFDETKPMGINFTWTQLEGNFTESIYNPYDTDYTFATTNHRVLLTRKSFGPFENATIQSFLYRMLEGEFHIMLTSFDFGPISRACVVWNITIHLVSSHNGPVRYWLDTDEFSACKGTDQLLKTTKSRHFWIFWVPNLSILLLTILFQRELILTIVQDSALLLSDYKLLKKIQMQEAKRKQRKQTRRRNKRVKLTSDAIVNLSPRARNIPRIQAQSSPHRMPPHKTSTSSSVNQDANYDYSRRENKQMRNMRHHLSFLRLTQALEEWTLLKRWQVAYLPTIQHHWGFCNSLACASLILSVVLSLCQGNASLFNAGGVHTGSVGLGACLLCFSLVRWISHKRKYSAITRTLARGLPKALAYIVGVLPIFVGYVVFGVARFGMHDERFATFPTAAITLFAVLNGDEIRATFLNTVTHDFLVAQIYLYSFTSLFIYVVLSCFVVIMELAYQELVDIQELQTSDEDEDDNEDINVESRLSVEYSPPCLSTRREKCSMDSDGRMDMNDMTRPLLLDANDEKSSDLDVSQTSRADDNDNDDNDKGKGKGKRLDMLNQLKLTLEANHRAQLKLLLSSFGPNQGIKDEDFIDLTADLLSLQQTCYQEMIRRVLATQGLAKSHG